MLCAVGLLVSSCSSRQTQADAAAEDAAGWVATELSGVPFERWSRLEATTHATKIIMTCGTDTYIAWAATLHGKDEINVLPHGAESPRRIRLRSTGASTEIGCGDDFIAWGRGSGRGDASMYLYDIATRKKTVLGATRAYARVHAQGDTLAYPEKTDGSRPGRWVIATWNR